MPADESTSEVSRLLEQWESATRNQTQLSALLAADNVTDMGTADGDTHLVAIIARLAEIVEKETEAYYKMDPDPFDDRHPGRADPNCALGHVLKVLFKNDNFMTKLVGEYLLYKDDQPTTRVLHTTACRLLLDIMPGLETTVIFQENEALIRNLIDWAQSAPDPLQSYATGLLASAMEIQDLAGIFKDSNAVLVPAMLRRLHSLQEQSRRLSAACRLPERPFHNIGRTPDRLATASNGVSDVISGVSTRVADTPPLTFEPIVVHDHNSMPTEGKHDDVVPAAAADVLPDVPSKRSRDEINNGDDEESNVEAEAVALSVSPGVESPVHKRARTEMFDGVKSSVVVAKNDDVVVAAVTHCNGDFLLPLSVSENKSIAMSPASVTVDSVKPIDGNCSLDRDQFNASSCLNASLGFSRSHSLSQLSVLGKSAGGMRSGNSSPRTWLGRRDVGNDGSNSCWAEMEPFVIGTYPMYPLTIEMQQRLILHYLQPMGEYQELLSHVFDQRVMDLLFWYIDLRQNTDVRLAFEALKYLAALLCHKRFAVDFISLGGVERLLAVYRPSVAATGVSMCLYYLAYFEDAMERVCLLPHSVLSDLVSCVLWLLECSHESGRVHATMFFGLSFPFRIIVELFDEQDGLRKLFNVLSTLPVMNGDINQDEMTEDQVFTSRQAARHVCVALRRYFEAHLALRSDQIRRSHMRSEGGSPLAETPAYKATKLSSDVIEDNVELLLECLASRTSWKPVSDFMKLGGIQLLMELISMATEWTTYTGKAETIRSTLEILAICSVIPRAQLQLCEPVKPPDADPLPAISILLGLAEGEVLADPDVQKAALNVIINSVCGPTSRLGGFTSRLGASRRKSGPRSCDDLLGSMWNAVRTNNGIMVLLKLMMVKVPITEADSIRALACKALVGLSRCDTVKQIIGKLPLFNNAQLQQLMWEPVLQDKRPEHVKFCKYATELIELVSGKPPHTSVDPSLDRIRRADIVAQTRIVYHEKELLQLIHDHLLKEGLVESAGALQREGNLPRPTTPPLPHPFAVQRYPPASSTPKLPRQPLTPSTSSVHPPFCAAAVPAIPSTSMLPSSGGGGAMSAVTPSTASRLALTPTSGTALRLTINKKTPTTSLTNHARFQQTKHIINQKNECVASGSVGYGANLSLSRRPVTGVKQEMCISLNKIVTSYLQHQHAACRNPIVTCPPFSLLTPHRCPDPKKRNSAPAGIMSRLYRRSIFPRYGGPDGMKFDRKFIYSRYRPIKSYRDSAEDCFSCCAFTVDEQYLMLGTYNGELKFYNVQTSEEYMSSTCHMSVMTHCQPSKDGKLILTSAAWGTPLSALWKIGDGVLEQLHDLSEDDYVEFSKHVQDRIIGTKDGVAHIYDVSTGRRLARLHDAERANNYSRNRATFNATDELVLNDGVLWDVDSGKSIHKFDKFNPNVSGVFHPNGLEVIINSEVWDLRNFHLLHTVPALDQCHIHFNHAGNVIYGAIHQDEDDGLDENIVKSPFGSSFRTFDGTDYSCIATVDVKRNIFDLCTDSSDCYLAVIENQRTPDTYNDESLCRLYEVGRLKDEDDDQADEEDEGPNEEEEDDDDDDDDDDDSVVDESQNAGNEENADENAAEGDNAAAGSGSDSEGSEFVVDSENSDSDDDSADENNSGDDGNADEDGTDDDDDMENMLFELSDMSNF